MQMKPERAEIRWCCSSSPLEKGRLGGDKQNIVGLYTEAQRRRGYNNVAAKIIDSEIQNTQNRSPKGLKDDRQVVECGARNPCK